MYLNVSLPHNSISRSRSDNQEKSTPQSSAISRIYGLVGTRMTTDMKAKLKKPDNKTNIDKYSVAANITEYLIK